MSEKSHRLEEQVMARGQERVAAELRGDVAFLDQLVTEDFGAIGPLGFTLTREQWLDRYRSGDFRYRSLVWDQVTVRVYGDAAVVTGRETQEADYKGQDSSGQFRTTQVYVKQGGMWHLAAIQFSPIAVRP
jgi:hypothetical protein